MLRYCFPKAVRLLRSRDFRVCAKYGSQRSGRLLHIQVRQTTYPGKKIGLTVPRRFGKATRRNRFKRLVREAFRLSQHEFPENTHISIRPHHRDSLTTSLTDIQQELLSLVFSTHSKLWAIDQKNSFKV